MRCIWSWWWNKSSGIGESTASKIAAMTAGVSFRRCKFQRRYVQDDELKNQNEILVEYVPGAASDYPARRPISYFVYIRLWTLIHELQYIKY